MQWCVHLVAWCCSGNHYTYGDGVIVMENRDITVKFTVFWFRWTLSWIGLYLISLDIIVNQVSSSLQYLPRLTWMIWASLLAKSQTQMVFFIGQSNIVCDCLVLIRISGYSYVKILCRLFPWLSRALWDRIMFYNG